MVGAPARRINRPAFLMAWHLHGCLPHAMPVIQLGETEPLPLQ
jgi:hypothetical protein